VVTGTATAGNSTGRSLHADRRILLRRHQHPLLSPVTSSNANKTINRNRMPTSSFGDGE
jgi:hypothetical protein